MSIFPEAVQVVIIYLFMIAAILFVGCIVLITPLATRMEAGISKINDIVLLIIIWLSLFVAVIFAMYVLYLCILALADIFNRNRAFV